ncbi:MAG: hypothetical protein EA382_16445 [Spirochaetaceae bacterium]|nr:MAG: hypothetical protein EA382_16445 [Spirochaetaceae bacterium]
MTQRHSWIQRIALATVFALACGIVTLHAGPAALTVTADSAGEVRARSVVPVPGQLLAGDLSIAARVSGDRADPSIAYRSTYVGAGPIAFGGLIAELRDPVGRSAATDHWATAARFRTDIGLTPPNRPGVWVATPVGVAVGAWDDRASARQIVAIIAGRSTLPTSVSATAGFSRAADQTVSSDAWFGWTAEQDVVYAAIASGLRFRRVAAGAAVGVSRPSLTLPGLWVRFGGASVIVPRALEARAYLSAVTPSFLDIRARTPSRSATGAVQVRSTIGPWSAALSTAVCGGWSERASFVWLPPPGELLPGSVDGSFTNSVLLRRADPALRVGVAAHADPVPFGAGRLADTGSDERVRIAGRVRAYAELRLAGIVTVTTATTARVAPAAADAARTAAFTHRLTAAVTADRVSSLIVPGSTLALRFSLDVDRTAARRAVPAASLRWTLRAVEAAPAASDGVDALAVEEHWVVPDGYRDDQSPTYSTSGSRS